MLVVDRSRIDNKGHGNKHRDDRCCADVKMNNGLLISQQSYAGFTRFGIKRISKQGLSLLFPTVDN